MKKLFNSSRVLLLVLAVSIPAVFALLRPGYFPMHDDIQAFRLLELDKCVKDGQIPCRWIPDMGYGYGYPQFNYYGPLPYYVMELFHLGGFGFLDSTKIGFLISVLLSGLGMYLLAKSLWGRLGGFISAVFYIYAPYRAVNIYVRGAMGEAWGMAFLPLIFWSTKAVLENKKYSQLWLVLSLAGLFASHNITAMIFIPFYVVWVVYLLYSNKRAYPLLKKNIIRLTLSGFWSFLMAAFFILPAFFEKKYVHIETLLMGYFNYLAHFVGLKQMLITAKWGYGVSELGPNDGMYLSPGIVYWLFPLIVLLLLYLFKKRKQLIKVLLIVILGWISLFLVHPRSVFIWEAIPLLAYVQFPWRFLTIATFCFSLAAGAIAAVLAKKNVSRILFTGAILFLVIITYGKYFKPSRVLDITDADKFSGEAWQKQLTISIFDYLPIYAKHPPTEKAPDEPIIGNDQGEVLSGQKGSDWQKWDIKINSQTAMVVFPVYYFPIWKASVNGQNAPISYDNELGLISLLLSKGDSQVNLKLTNTPIRNISNAFTLISLIAVPLYLVREKKKNVKKS
jgi:hypothetical protein